MANVEEVEYEKFLEKVRRTVYVDELTPLATKAIVESAFDQFGTVKDVIFVPNYLGPKELPISVLVEMESEEKARGVISTLSQYPFMVAGMPRPVRASEAKLEMFADRPRKPGRRIQCRWLSPEDPDFDKAMKVKKLVRKHSAEVSFLNKIQLEEAEKLADKHSETAMTHHKKYDTIDKLVQSGVPQILAEKYKLKSFPQR